MSMRLISKIRVAGTTDIVPAEIHLCEFEDMVLWQRKIQKPFIAPLGGIGSNWDWPALFVACTLTEAAMGRQAISLQIRGEGPNGRAIPVAQAIYSRPYAYPGNPGESCVFVWFIASTPEAALKSFGISHKFATMAPLLDTAIQLSLDAGLDGRIGLHAALGATRKESDALVDRYLRQGLSRRTQGKGFFRAPFRREDGRLFYFNPAAARLYAAAQDDLR